MKRVFLAWKPYCTRSHNQAKHFDAKEIYISYFGNRNSVGASLARYFFSFFRTLRVLNQERPDVVFTLNQPPFLILAVYLFTRLRGGVYVLDSHSAPFNDPRWAWARPLYRFIATRAFVNINTNVEHKSLVESWGGRSVIVGDVPIDHERTYPDMEIPHNSIVVVASYMFDEPIREILLAAKATPQAQFYLTGDDKKLNRLLITDLPPNVQFTGFLSREEYFGMLSSAAGIMVLTTRDQTMQRGAYEALSLEQPLITSDWAILRESFGDAALYVDNSPESIASAVRMLLENRDSLKNAAIRQRKSRREYFDHVRRDLLNQLASLQEFA